MEGSVKGVFKVLISVPIIVTIVYLIFNVFSFATSYFRLLGASYAIQNIVMENNYIPKTEYDQMSAYLATLETATLQNVHIVGLTGSDSERRQYGYVHPNVGVTGTYVWAIPFMPQSNKEMDEDLMSGGANSTWEGVNEEGKTALENGRGLPITITYSVPGLAYYPDL